MKKFLSLVLALVMAMSLVTISAGAKDFTDDSKVNYAEAVDVISALGIVDGYTDGSFRPTTELNRAQAAKIICNMVLGPTTASALSASAAPFSDVPADHWAAGYIAYCAKEGIIAGMGDGTFHPADTLTGYAFMKMLLTAIGYDAEMEGFVGANWGVNVAKQAIGIDLDDGNDDFVGTAKVTREEACLYAFNALTATMVKYGSKTTVNVNGATVVVGGSEATDVDGKGYKNYKGGETNDTLEFCEKYFPNLKLVDTASDDFGRPANTWKIKSKEVGTYAKAPALTYTEEVKGYEIYEDLGKPEVGTVKTYTNSETGVKAAEKLLAKKSDTDKTSQTKIGGNGVLVEVFTDDNGDDVDVDIVIINTYIGEVADVTENDDDERVVVVDGEEYVTEEFEEDDMVLYTAADGDIQSMVLAEKKTGELTKKVGSTYTIDGEEYKLTKGTTTTVKVKDDVDYYLDAYGYIIKMDVAEESTSVDNLAYVLKAGESRGEGWAKLLFTDGTTKTVDTDEDYSKLLDKVVSFKSDDGVYELKDKTTSSKTATNFEKGDTKMGGVRVDSKTVFVYMINTLDKDGKVDDTDYKAYTSFKKAPGFDTAKITYYAKDSVANVVYVEVNDTGLASNSDALIFLAAQKDLDVNDDGDDEWYEFQAIVDGKITTLNVLTDADNLDTLIDGVLVYKTATFNADDMVKKFTTASVTTPNAKGDYYVAETCEKESNEVILLDGDDYAYADDVKVFVVDDDEIAAGGISTIREDDTSAEVKGTKDPYASILFTLNDDGDVDTIVLVKK